jgi:hypothetical protein
MLERFVVIEALVAERPSVTGMTEDSVCCNSTSFALINRIVIVKDFQVLAPIPSEPE